MNLIRLRARVEREFKMNYRDWIIIGMSALVIRYVLLAPLNWIWDGWLVSISAIGSVIFMNYFKKLYGIRG